MEMKIFDILVAFLLSCGVSSALECYVCTGSEADCKDVTGAKTTKVTCAGSCSTLIFEDYFFSTGRYITRSCESSCTASQGIDFTNSERFCCSTDNCNTEDRRTGYTLCHDCTSVLQASGCPKEPAENHDWTQVGTTECKGQCTKINSKWLGISSTTRTCDPNCSPGNVDVLGIKANTLCCDGDLCNGASALTSMTTSIIVVTMAVFLL